MRGFSKIHDLVAGYEKYVTYTVSKSTAYNYKRALETFLDRFPDKTEPTQFSRADVEDYKLQRLRDGAAPNTIVYEMGRVSGFWRWLMDRGLISWNPVSGVKMPKSKEPKRISLSLTEQHRLKDACFNWCDRALVALAMTTGLRGTTLISLEKKDVDFENLALRIPSGKMKTGRNHEIPLPAWVVELLKEAPEEGTIFGKYAKSSHGIWYRINRIFDRAGLKKYRGIRTMRRTFATTLLRSGADLKMVQDLLGHVNIETTSRYLTPADTATVRKALDKLPRLDGEN